MCNEILIIAIKQPAANWDMVHTMSNVLKMKNVSKASDNLISSVSI